MSNVIGRRSFFKFPYKSIDPDIILLIVGELKT
jgi:hypothetical protein